MPVVDVVHLAGQELKLLPPQSYATRFEVATRVLRAPERAFAACLGVCIPRGAWPIKDKAKREKGRPIYEGDPIAYGGAVIDALHEAGLGMKEILDAGEVAYLLLSPSVFSEKELAEQEDFSAAPLEGGGPAR